VVTDNATTILDGAVRLSVPLLFAGAGEFVAERAGTLNISVEAMMLGGAFGGAFTASATGHLALGLVVGAGVGLAIGLVHGNFSHRLAANTFVVGLTLNALVLGLTSYLIAGRTLDQWTSSTQPVPGLSRIPVLGPPLFDQPWPAYLIYGLIPLIWFILYRSRWGLEVRSVGENPQAADVSGVDVNRRRRQTLLLVGFLAGLGGAFYSVYQVSTFNAGMTAGRGFIVIAAVIFGGWTLRGTVIGCLLFGFADALQLNFQALGYRLNPELLICAPYLVALLAMTLFAKRNRQPGALARPFERGIT
jgi:general nucleoside transport system permease protein